MGDSGVAGHGEGAGWCAGGQCTSRADTVTAPRCLCLSRARSCSFTNGSCSGRSQKPAVYRKINLGWERPLRSSPAINMTLPSPPLNQVSKCYICMSFLIPPKYLIRIRNGLLHWALTGTEEKCCVPSCSPVLSQPASPPKSWGALCITMLCCRGILHNTPLYAF